MINKILKLIAASFLIFSCKAKKDKSKQLDYADNSESEVHYEAPVSTYQIVWRRDNTNSLDFILRILEQNKISYTILENQIWDSKTSTIGGIRDYKLSMMGDAGNNWTSLRLHLNSDLGINIAQLISRKVKSPVIVFMEYDQSAWGYKLIVNGEIKNYFCNDPILVGIDSSNCKADIKIIEEYFSVNEDQISPYLRFVSDLKEGEKAFPNDEFELRNHWARVDFMKRLGIIYPDNGTWFYLIEKGIND